MWGLTVSGQTLKNVLRKVTRLIKKGEVPEKKVFLMLGTNDMLVRGTQEEISVASMCSKLWCIINILADNTEQIVVLTLPPIPKHYHQKDDIDRMCQYNRYIRKLAKNR
jgi:lysophospholipase L1-like esterase